MNEKQKKEIVSVTVILFPDGQNYYFESKLGFDHVREIVHKWRAKYGKKYEGLSVMNCVAHIRMTREDYFHIPTMNWLD